MCSNPLLFHCFGLPGAHCAAYFLTYHKYGPDVKKSIGAAPVKGARRYFS
jgi:hypothetical protein